MERIRIIADPRPIVDDPREAMLAAAVALHVAHGRSKAPRPRPIRTPPRGRTIIACGRRGITLVGSDGREAFYPWQP